MGQVWQETQGADCVSMEIAAPTSYLTVKPGLKGQIPRPWGSDTPNSGFSKQDQWSFIGSINNLNSISRVKKDVFCDRWSIIIAVLEVMKKIHLSATRATALSVPYIL